MSKQTQRAPETESTHASSGQGAQGPVTEDAGVATAEQVGNAATQEEMQGGQGQASAEGGWMEAGGHLLEDAANWGVEQITSVERFATFVKAVGESAAQRILPSLSTDLLREIALWTLGVDSMEEMGWHVLDLLLETDFLGSLPAAKLAWLVSSALVRGAMWLLDGFASFDSALLLQITAQLSEMQCAELFELGCALTDALFEAVWPSGMGIAFELDFKGKWSSIALGANYQCVARHVGRGALEMTITVSGAAGGDVGVGGGSDDKKVEAKFVVEAGGSIRLDFAAADATSWDGLALFAVAAGLGCVIAPGEVASYVTDWDFHLADLLTGFAIEGQVRNGAEAGGDLVEEFGMGLAACAELGLGVEMTGLSGGWLDHGSCTLSAGAELVVDGKFNLPKMKLGGKDENGKASSLDMGGLEAALLGGSLTAKLHFDFDLTGGEVFSNVRVEVVGEVAVGGGSLEVGVEADGPMPENASELIDSLRALNVALHLPIGDEKACGLLEDSLYYELIEATGLDVKGAIDVEARLDAEAFQFIAETAWHVYSRDSDPKKAFADLCAWARDPLNPIYADLQQLLVMELAQTADLKAELDCSVTVENGVGLEVALGTKWGASMKVGMTIDLKTDLLKGGTTITSTDLKGLLGHRDTISTPY